LSAEGVDHQAGCIGGEEGSPMFAEDRNFGEGQAPYIGLINSPVVSKLRQNRYLYYLLQSRAGVNYSLEV
jgi:hypothetical protein